MVVSFSGTGSQEDPIQISGISTNAEAVQAEYQYLNERFGKAGSDWTLVRQALIRLPAGGMGDVMTIRLADGQTAEIFFDISPYFGKW
jgi:hypothetical protein